MSISTPSLLSQRTYLAWIRTSLALLVLGVGLERFEKLREDIIHIQPNHSAVASAIASTLAASSLPASPAPNTRWSTLDPRDLTHNRQLSLLLSGTGALLATTSTYRYFTILRRLQEGKFVPNVRGVAVFSLSTAAIFYAVLSSALKGHAPEEIARIELHKK